MAAPRMGSTASGRLGFLPSLFLFAWFLPTASGFKITSIGGFAQCAPTVITWDIGQSLPPFTVSISIASNPTDDSLTFSGFEGSSATVTLNLPAKTLVNVALVNSGGVLDQVSNVVVQPGTDSVCANTALSGLAASTVPDLPETSDSTSSSDASSVTASLPVVSTHTLKPHKKPSVPTATFKSTSQAPITPAAFSLSNFFSPTPSFVLPSSSLNSSTSGKGLQPGAIGAIVICSILAFALGLWLLFWCKRKRQRQRGETRHTRLPSPEPREAPLRDSVSVVTIEDTHPPSIPVRDPNCPSSVNATIGLPSAEAIMEHRNKPLPTPDTPSSKSRTGFASSPGASSSQPTTSPRSLTSTPSTISITMPGVGRPRGFARRVQDSGGTASESGRSVRRQRHVEQRFYCSSPIRRV